jgi:hypothetical protein
MTSPSFGAFGEGISRPLPAPKIEKGSRYTYRKRVHGGVSRVEYTVCNSRVDKKMAFHGK